MLGVERAELWSPAFSPRGVIEILEPLAGDERRDLLRAVSRDRVGSVTVVMDAPHDPHNGSAILRSCDAFGLPLVHVVRRGERFLLARKVTKGSERWVEVHEHANVPEAVGALASAGFELVATHPEGSLVPEDLAMIPRLALVLGNEHDGIREELRLAAPRAVRIPMRGFVESLNVSVAAAVLLRAATAGRPGDLSDDERARYYARSLCRSVPRAAEILAGSKPR